MQSGPQAKLLCVAGPFYTPLMSQPRVDYEKEEQYRANFPLLFCPMSVQIVKHCLTDYRLRPFGQLYWHPSRHSQPHIFQVTVKKQSRWRKYKMLPGHFYLQLFQRVGTTCPGVSFAIRAIYTFHDFQNVYSQTESDCDLFTYLQHDTMVYCAACFRLIEMCSSLCLCSESFHLYQ